jgi:hypothetical protein
MQPPRPVSEVAIGQAIAYFVFAKRFLFLFFERAPYFVKKKLGKYL